VDSKWYGIAGILKYDFSDYFSMSARGEYFDDKDGARTGTAQKLKEITITPEFRVAKSVIVRPEFRHDWSDQDSFDVVSGVGTTKHQDTIALGVMYTW
jgi:maltoporin